jgi:hypothetical protein
MTAGHAAQAHPARARAPQAHVPHGVLRRKCSCGGQPGATGECDTCREKREAALRRSARLGTHEDAGVAAPPIAYDALRSPGQSLDPGTRAFFESRMGHDFGRIRVHTDTLASDSAAALNAAAYTVGRDIVFGAGRYSPGTADGDRLLAHELAHVVQQYVSSGATATDAAHSAPADLRVLPPGHRGEAQADSAADAALAGRHPAMGLMPGPTAPAIQRQVFPIVFGRTLSYQRQCPRLAGGSASPWGGIGISWNQKQVTITAKLQVNGPEASPAVATQIEATIKKIWNASFPDGYAVSTNVTATYRAPGDSVDFGAVDVYVYKGGGSRSDVTSIVLGVRTMTYLNIDHGLDWAPAHEFAHMLGLKDRYHTSEDVLGFLRREITGSGERGQVTVEAGYEGNIMGESGGKLESKNIKDLIETYACENVRPSQYTPPEA